MGEIFHLIYKICDEGLLANFIASNMSITILSYCMHFAGRIFKKKSQSMSNLFTFLNTIVMQTELLLHSSLLLHNYYLQLSVLMRSTQQLNLLA